MFTATKQIKFCPIRLHLQTIGTKILFFVKKTVKLLINLLTVIKKVVFLPRF